MAKKTMDKVRVTRKLIGGNCGWDMSLYQKEYGVIMVGLMVVVVPNAVVVVVVIIVDTELLFDNFFCVKKSSCFVPHYSNN
jgi:hypothetical protein